MSDETTTTENGGGKGPRGPRERDIATPVVKDEALLAFLEDLFYADPEPEQYPERIELNVVAGRYSEQLKSIVWTQQFAPIKATGEVLKKSAGQAKPSKERLVALSNLLLQRMQQDCDQCGHRRAYGVHAWSTSRGDEPYMRFLKTVDPKGRYSREGQEEEDGVGPLSERDRFLVQMSDQQRKMFEFYGEALAGLIDRYNRDKERDSSEIDRLHKQLSSKNEQLERALSLELDREERREWVRLRRQMADKGWAAVETYAPLLLASVVGKAKVIDSPPAANDPTIVDALRGFLRMTGEGGQLTPEQAVAAFGDWDKATGTLITPGILTAEQSVILVHVATGQAPTSEIDRLIPPNGSNPITPQQLAALVKLFPMDQIAPLQQVFMKRNQQGAR